MTTTTCVCSACMLPLFTGTGNPLPNNQNNGENGVPQPQPGPSSMSMTMTMICGIPVGPAKVVVIALKCGHVVHQHCFEYHNVGSPTRKCPQCLVTIPRNAKMLPLHFLGDEAARQKRELELEAAKNRQKEVIERYEARLAEITAKYEASVKLAEKANQDYQDLIQDYERKAALVSVLSFEQEENQQKVMKQMKKLDDMETVMRAMKSRNEREEATTPRKTVSGASDRKDSSEPSPKRCKDL